MESGLELKFAGGKPVMTEGAVIEGYASRFGLPDHGGEIVAKGAFAASLPPNTPNVELGFISITLFSETWSASASQCPWCASCCTRRADWQIPASARVMS